MVELLSDMTKLEEIKEEYNYIIDKKVTSMLVSNIPLLLFQLCIAVFSIFAIGWASLVLFVPIGWILVGLIMDIYHVRHLRKFTKRFSDSWFLKKIPQQLKEE